MTNLKKNIFCLTIFLFVLLFFLNNCLDAALYQDVEFASSPNPVGSGARATGMGGAFIGIADDATSASWNPAGLIQLEKPEISIVGAYLSNRDIFSSDIYTEISKTGKVDDLNIDIKKTIYRAMQEGITNGIRHGSSKTFKIELKNKGEMLYFDLADNGRGCDNIKFGFGLTNMNDRVKKLKGQLKVREGQNNGCKLSIRIPIKEVEKLKCQK